MRGGGPIWLLGMMGAGKSSVGCELASGLARDFIDTDAAVERAAGRTVAEIFAEEGEAAFRRWERAEVVACAASDAVVALGGGAGAEPETARIVRGAGRSVYLRACPETLLDRLGDAGSRPLLAGLPAPARLDRLRDLLAEREPAYGQADASIDTDGLSIGEVASEVAARLDLPWEAVS